MDKEIRNFTIEFNANPESRMVEGRAIPFNVFSPNREGFREMVSPSAVEGVFEKSDIKMLYNHDNSKGFLARNNKGKGTMKIDVREDGVYFSFKAKKDNLSNYIFERLADGELNETSWAFTVGEEEWKKCDDGTYERTITKFERLYDFSIVDNSYYGIEGSVGCKRFAELQEEDRKALEEAKKAEEERIAKEEQEKREAEEAAKQEAIKAAYDKLVEEYKQYMTQQTK